MEECEGGGEKRPLVLLLFPLLPLWEERLSRKYRFLKPWESQMQRDEFLGAHAQEVRVLICHALSPPVDSAMLQALPRLQCVVVASAGVDTIDLAECRRRGILVSNAGEVYSEDVADYALGLLLDVLRRISDSDRYLRSGLWSRQGDYPLLGRKLSGKRVGIVGLGSIGLEVVKRLEAFGCRIAYNSRTKKPSLSYPYFSSVRDLAAESDAIIICCALTDETYHLINRDVLLALGKDGVVINVGRGALVDEKELVRCLLQGEIGGAGLDVFEDEPHVPQELIAMDNVVLSPHRAVLTPESFSALIDVIAGNLEAFFSSKPLLTPV